MKLEALFLDIDIDDSEYVLTVTAFNEGQTFSGTQTSVRILVKDLNNKKPTFLESDDYAITIPENLVCLCNMDNFEKDESKLLLIDVIDFSTF